MKRQFNIVQTSLKMEKKIITANSFHETSITLIPSPQKKKKKTCKRKITGKSHWWTWGPPSSNIGSLPAIYKKQSSWLHFLGYSLSCYNKKTSQHSSLKKTRCISVSHPDVNGLNLPSPTHPGLQPYFCQYFLSGGEVKTHGIAFKEMVIQTALTTSIHTLFLQM